MLYRRAIIPRRLEELWGLTPALAEAFARKESLACTHCGASLRVRRLARVLLETEAGDSPARSISEWVERPHARRLRIAEINRIEGLHRFLATLPGLAFSDFQPGTLPDSAAGGVRSEDLTRLTYADASFDLVLTSETLEHVPDLTAALAEVRRVLVPGGRHVFTVPVLPAVPATFARAELSGDGQLIAHAPLIRHPGGDAGYPVFTEFGADLAALIERAGFRVEVRFGPTRVDDVAQVYIATRLDGPEPGSPRPS
jgi:SAM-dependent methyltransferase